MTLRFDFLLAVAAMALAAYACRASGFFLMRYVTITPRIKAALQTLPMALIMSVLSVGAVKGGLAEWLGLATSLSVMWFVRNEFFAIVAGVAMVALTRAVLF